MDEQIAVNKLALLCTMLWQECITETDLRKTAKYARLTSSITSALLLLANGNRAKLEIVSNGERHTVTAISAIGLLFFVENSDEIVSISAC